MKNGRAALLMAAGLLLFSAGVSAQSIAPLKLDKVNVKQAIYELKHSTGFSFVFATGDIDNRSWPVRMSASKSKVRTSSSPGRSRRKPNPPRVSSSTAAAMQSSVPEWW